VSTKLAKTAKLCAACILLPVLVGCGSAVPTKPVAVRKPAQVRVYNFTDKPFDSWIDTQQMSTELGSGACSGFRMTSLKDHTVKASYAGVAAGSAHKFKAESEKLYTLVGMVKGGKGDAVLLTEEPRSAAPGHSSVVFVGCVDRPDLKATIKESGKSIDGGAIVPGQVTKPVDLAPGLATLVITKGGKEVATFDATLADGKGNTAFVWSEGGKITILFSDNTPRMTIGGPTGGSAAG